ncbi:hypothetical protein M758_1G187800 [Ceratodon purpureus]|uniref:Uncharacterized protein n=1 Tax=Ceratodon purpureus TaxID=3225 RepID=A0A8T0IEH9_CERPU|nr:hypothetical protein KC19_3G008800 [Ceratodon purpureus]KAG0630563.1 hypothetical protein M758_1G187800 [Ceratodon purpureus]
MLHCDGELDHSPGQARGWSIQEAGAGSKLRECCQGAVDFASLGRHRLAALERSGDYVLGALQCEFCWGEGALQAISACGAISPLRFTVGWYELVLSWIFLSLSTGIRGLGLLG